MRKLLAVIGWFVLFLLPIATFQFAKNYFDYYDDLGRQYDCYPFEKCQIDIDGDSKLDIVKIVDESAPNNKYNFRLRVFLSRETPQSEVLDLKYEPTDNTFRTHIAFFVEDGVRKFTIYDTKNEQQHFYWNGQNLVPTQKPSALETEIRKALGYNDDTGGFHMKIFYPLVLTAVSIIYYSLFFTFIGVYLYFRKIRDLVLP